MWDVLAVISAYTVGIIVLKNRYRKRERDSDRGSEHHPEKTKMMWDLTAALCLVWAATLLYGEMFSFWLPPLLTCSCPHHHLPSTPPIDGVDHSKDYTKVVVIADPQIMDRTSLELAPESLSLEMAKFYTDLYMRRVMLSSVLPLQPDVILFLGDHFDGGPVLSDDEWQDSLSRFKHIFNLNVIKKSRNIQILYLPGNHDIGYAAFNSRMPEVIKRYEKEFHSRNYHFKVGSVDFIAIDAQTVDGNPQGNLTSSTWEFIKNISKDINSSPRVLFSHIPLYRPDHTLCGRYRSSPVINQRITRAAQNQEIIYQNYVTEESSTRLLDLIKPVLVLSGHDHDQCTVTHSSNHGSVIEHTVGSVSWQQGNIYPSFMLLSARNNPSPTNASSNTEDVVLTNLCFLPVQLFIYIWYICLFVLTLGVLLLWPTNGLGLSRYFNSFMEYIISLTASGATKEKIDEDNYEYGMVWDAEGTMHLIKKPVELPAKISSDMPLVERGNAVIRPTAKKQMSQEIESEGGSVSVDLDQAVAKLPSRTSKSKTRFIIQRLIRTLKMIVVIAAVNFPLYVMLLFKDWVDK